MVIRVGSKQAQAARTRAALASSARQLLTANAYETVTLKAVAACAGHSQRAIYRYWPNKAALWRDVMGCEPPLDSDQVRQSSMVLAGHEALIRDLTSLLDAIDKGEPKAKLITQVRAMLDEQLNAVRVPVRGGASEAGTDADAGIEVSASTVSIGARLRAIRLARGVRQVDLAEVLGVSIPQVCRYERAQAHIPAGRIVKLAQRLGCSVEELLEGAA